MKRITVMIMLAVFAIATSGCVKGVLNPYSEKFKCPDGFDGECTTVSDAYNKSLSEQPKEEAFSPMVKKKSNTKAPTKESNEKYEYQKELYKELTGLIKQPVTPVMMPSKQVRVLIPGYTDEDNNYFAPRYVYFIARTAKWTLPTDGGIVKDKDAFSIDNQ